MSNMKKVLFPGSFDPFTIGHEIIVNEALNMGFQPVICFMNNPNKERMFPVDKMINAVSRIWNDKVLIEKYDGNVSTFCDINCIDYIIRGIRNSTDFEYEKNMSIYHYKFFGLHTILIPTDNDISSTMVRELCKLKEFNTIRINRLVSPSVYDLIKIL